MSTELAEAKRNARRCALKLRASTASSADAARAVRNLTGILEKSGAERSISGYLAVGSELNPIAAMTRFATDGRTVAVPVVDAPGRPLKFRQWLPGTRLITADHGIPVPATGSWIRPEILIVPLLAFDRRRFRLGYGGGYYDLTLAALRSSGSVLAIGLAHSCQEIERVPTESFDQQLDMIVTELGVIGTGDVSHN